MKKTHKEKVDILKNLCDIQCTKGNYDTSDYMRGMANGLILAVAVFEEKEPVYLKPIIKQTKK